MWLYLGAEWEPTKWWAWRGGMVEVAVPADANGAPGSALVVLRVTVLADLHPPAASAEPPGKDYALSVDCFVLDWLPDNLGMRWERGQAEEWLGIGDQRQHEVTTRMTANLIRDDIDFGAYMASTEANHKLIPAGAFAEEVADYLENGLQLTGARLPWRKTRDLIRFRPGEVTLWSGMNGHGKSLALGQAAAGFVCQREPLCVHSRDATRCDPRPHGPTDHRRRQPDRAAVLALHEIWSSWWLYDQQGQVHTPRRSWP